MLDAQKTNQLIWRVFTLANGLTLQADAVAYLRERLGAAAGEEAQLVRSLSYVAASYKKQNGSAPLVDASSLAAVIEAMLRLGSAEEGRGRALPRTFVNVLPADAAPHFIYDPHAKIFAPTSVRERSVFGEAPSKGALFRRRYEIIKQRIARGAEGKASLLPALHRHISKLATIKAVKSQRPDQERTIFGMLSEIREGELFLEDPEDSIKIDIGHLSGGTPNGATQLFTEGSFVILTGHVAEGTSAFTVTAASPPPIEPRCETLALASHPDHAEGSSFAESIDRIRKMERHNANASLVVVSDAWLDCSRTLGKLDGMFGECDRMEEGAAPIAFVLMGPFTRRPGACPSPSDAVKALEDGLASLAAVLAKYSTLLARSKFILVPATSDALSPGTVLPRFALPATLAERAFSALPSYTPDSFTMASNPCRLFFFSKEIVLFRNDSNSQIWRHVIERISTRADGARETSLQAVETLLQQSHLAPLTLGAQLRPWEYDHALDLYPIPDFLVIGQHSMPQEEATFADCTYINPGSFPTANASFAIIQPLLGKAGI